MSTRWYPIYQKGAPQLRVFLPNFWMKLIKPREEQPPNVVQFSVSKEMTKEDIKNYLDKIYDVKIADVRTRIEPGKITKDRIKGYLAKADDVKLAYITLPRGESFTFPNLFPKESDDKVKEEEKSLEQAKQGYRKYVKKNDSRRNNPGWFAI